MTSHQGSWKPTTAFPVAGLLYLAAAVILVDQAAILVASVYPPAPASVQWRFGATGLAAGRATPFLIADLMLIAGGILGGHRLLLRGVAALHLILTVVLLATVALFVLDTLEMRQLLPLEGRRQALLSAGRAAVALTVLSGYALWSAVAIFRRTPRPPAGRSADRRIVLETRAGSDA